MFTSRQPNAAVPDMASNSLIRLKAALLAHNLCVVSHTMGDRFKKMDNVGRGNCDSREPHARPRLFRLLPRQLGKTRHLCFLFSLGWETGSPVKVV